MKIKKNGLLSFISIVEIVMGAANLLSGVMSLIGLIGQGQALLDAMEATSGIRYSMSYMVYSVVMTLVAAIIFLVAGICGLKANGKPGKENICLILGFVLFAYIVITDVIAIVVMRQISGFNITMLLPFLLHGLYLLGAYKNKQTVEAAE